MIAVVATLAATLVVVLDRGPKAPTRANPQNGWAGVLLVPGCGGSTDALESLADAPAWHRPHRDVVVSLPGDGTGDLDQQAAALARAVSAARSGTERATVDHRRLPPQVGWLHGLWARDHSSASVAVES